MFPITQQELNDAMKRVGITDITEATIRQISSLASELEDIAGDRMVHLEIGNPGIPANALGVEAEREVLRKGIANQYPNIAGIPQLKRNGSRFLKAFLDIDMPGDCIIPTVGSMQGGYASMLLLAHRDPKKDTMLFINPGFPAQRYQARILGLKEASFDIYSCRGKALEAKLEEMFSKGNVTAMIYGTPNNPAWINLTEEELEIIGRMATKYDVIVLEDLAYVGMDFRTNFGKPGEPPFIPTVARYTDNYMLLVSASKIFSYAGQRIAMVCFSPSVAARESEALNDYFGMSAYLRTFVFGVLYALSSGTAHSAQHAFATMLGAAADGRLNFVEDCREYERRGARAKDLFTSNGFHVVYDRDGQEPISDGFFFTAGYKDMPSDDLQAEMMRYGIAAISLPSTGSEQNGLRVCVSMLTDDCHYDSLEDRLNRFNRDH
ncbi:MAG: pyridoxal phosphate-dependent aminotransferase [Muribaculaceae bacterium]|nr:pyridoxal phosphate-dependent aminotransferase [Muribaculaceae bacterium]